MTAFLGMRGTGDWAADERPKSWRETILFLYPNGKMPITAITSKLKDEQVDDPEYNWWTKQLASQAGAVTNIYDDSAMGSAYTSGGSAGDVLYVKVAESVAAEFRPGHTCVLRDSDDYLVDTVGKVVGVTKNGASSKIAVKLREADSNTGSHDLSDADRILINGTVQPEGAPMPDSVHYNPTKVYNYTQIFESPLELTRTALRTKLRTKESYVESKREALELLGIMMEKAWIWGIRDESTGDNGKPERMTGGLLYFIKNNASDNMDDFTTNADYSGYDWLQAGEQWLDEQLEQIFRYGADEKLALCGSGALLGINRLAKTNGSIQLRPKAGAYGIRVMEWITPFGIINLKTHPLFSYESTNRNSMLVFEPKSIRYNYIDDVFFKPDKEYKEGGTGKVDGIKESYLAEAGLEIHHPEKAGYLNGLNQDNTS